MSNLERKKQVFIEFVAPDIKLLGKAFAKTFNKRRPFHEVMQFMKLNCKNIILSSNDWFISLVK